MPDVLSALDLCGRCGSDLQRLSAVSEANNELANGVNLRCVSQSTWILGHVYANCLHLAGQLHERLGLVREAEFYFRQGLRLSQTLRAANRVFVFLMDLAFLYWNLGNASESQSLFKQASSLLEKVFRVAS